MDKKKIVIIAVILLLGLGTFVFANPDDNLEDNNIDNYYGNQEEKDQKKDTLTNINNNNNNNEDESILDNNISIANPSSVLSNINQYFNSNNQTNNQNQNNNNNNNNNNNQTNNDNNSNNTNNGNNTGENNNDNKPVEPNPPEEKPDLPIVENIDEIRKLLATLKNKVETSSKREDILLAKDYRDKNNIKDSISKINDEIIKNELLKILNDLNKIIDDNTKPQILGIKNQEITNLDVSLTIKEESIKKILLNDEDITNSQELLKSIKEENTYTLIVIDSAYNEEKITFTIDKTPPIINVETSNNNQETNDDVTVYIKSNEELQAITGWKLSSDKKILSKVFTDNTNGVQTLEVKDIAGNKITAKYEVVNIKNNKPSVAEKDITYSTKELTNGDVVVTIKVSKPVFAPEGWTPSEGYTVFTKTFTKNEKEVVLLRDILGNTNVVNIVVDNIDKELPSAKVEYSISQNIKTNKKVEVVIKLNEKVKNPVDNTWTLSKDSLSIKKTYTKNTQELIEVEDLAGNKVFIPIDVKNIDKNLDGITIRTSNDDVSTNNDVTVTITSPKELEEVTGWKLSKDKKKLTKVFDKNIIDIVEIKTVDGDIYAVEFEVKNIDKNPPVVNENDIIYEKTNDGAIIVTIKVSKSIFTPGEGWEASEGYTVFTKKYTENIDETICLRDIYGNTSNLHLKADLKAIDQINNFTGLKNNFFSSMANKIFK